MRKVYQILWLLKLQVKVEWFLKSLHLTQLRLMVSTKANF